MATFGEIARRDGGWLPLIGVTALVGALGTLALPTVFGHSVDTLVAGQDSDHWLGLAIGLIVIGILVRLFDKSFVRDRTHHLVHLADALARPGVQRDLIRRRRTRHVGDRPGREPGFGPPKQSSS